jgi:hypothetical protein
VSLGVHRSDTTVLQTSGLSALAFELVPRSVLSSTWALVGCATVLVAAWRTSLALRSVGVVVLVSAAIAALIDDGGSLVSLLLVASLLFAKRLDSKVSNPLLAVVVVIAMSVVLCRGLALALPMALATLGWGAGAFLLVALGLALRDRILRVAGLVVLACAILRLVVFDLSGLPTDGRILTFVLLGVAMLALSFGYARFKERLTQWL